MKYKLVILAVIFSFMPNAHSAVTPKLMTQISQVDSDAIGVLVSDKQIAVYGNREKNGFIQFVNGATLELSGGVENFVSAGTIDVLGNIYLVGASSNPVVNSQVDVSGILNPDNVVAVPTFPTKTDALHLTYWKIDSVGNLLDLQIMQMENPILPSSIIVDSFGITVAGASYADNGSNSFVVNWNSAPIFIGSSNTRIFGISRTLEGDLIAVGQSAEKLLATSLKGKNDGFLAKIKSGKLVSVQRSSDVNANRAWRSTTQNLFIGGFSNSTATITKFNFNFQPTWSDRYPSNGTALTASVGKNNFGAFVSMGTFKTLPTWKKKNAILVLTFDSKGVIKDAKYINSMQLTGFTANSHLGTIVLSGGFLYRA